MDPTLHPSADNEKKKEIKKTRNACADDRGIMLCVPPIVASSAYAPGPNMRRVKMTNGWGVLFHAEKRPESGRASPLHVRKTRPKTPYREIMLK